MKMFAELERKPDNADDEQPIANYPQQAQVLLNESRSGETEEKGNYVWSPIIHRTIKLHVNPINLETSAPAKLPLPLPPIHCESAFGSTFPSSCERSENPQGQYP